MTNEDFIQCMSDALRKSDNILANKRAEYTPGADRLLSFKTAAKLQGNTPIAALGGMLSKHIVSFYDYIERVSNKDHPEYISLEQWDEKIIDILNYMLLARALLQEEQNNRTEVALSSE